MNLVPTVFITDLDSLQTSSLPSNGFKVSLLSSIKIVPIVYLIFNYNQSLTIRNNESFNFYKKVFLRTALISSL